MKFKTLEVKGRKDSENLNIIVSLIRKERCTVCGLRVQ
jgi:hypothetical protein